MNSKDTTAIQRAKTGPKPSRNEDRLQSLRQLHDLLRTPRRRTLLLRMVLPIHVRARKRPRTRRLQHILHPRNTTTLHRLRVHNRSSNSRILLHPTIHESRLEETTPRHIPTLHIKLHDSPRLRRSHSRTHVEVDLGERPQVHALRRDSKRRRTNRPTRLRRSQRNKRRSRPITINQLSRLTPRIRRSNPHWRRHEKVLPRNNRPPIPETIPPSTSLPRLTRNNRRDLRTDAHRLPTNARRHAQHHGIHRWKPRRHRRVLVHVPHGLHTHTNLRSNVPLHTRHYAAERLGEEKCQVQTNPNQLPLQDPQSTPGRVERSRRKERAGAQYPVSSRR